MEGILVLCIGLIGYLFYRTNGQKNQLSILQSQLYKLQQQFLQLQQQIVKPEANTETIDDTSVETSPIEELTVQEVPVEEATHNTDLVAGQDENSNTNKDKWRVEPQSNSIREPSALEQGLTQLITLAKNYFSQGNQIVRIGIIVLFFGMSFLAKYSIENSLISIEVRMAAIVIAALIMLGIGWHLRLKNPAYGLMMQGGGIAISYIAIFASFKLYQLIPSEFTFPLLIVFSLLAMSLAMLQNSKALAITAITGGFAAPILASTGQGSHIGLFSYYLVLNCAIFFVAWFKSWRLLNVVGFLFTFIIASFWGVTQYRSAHFATTEPFLISFFLIYVAISILFSIKQKPELKGYVDGTLVFGVPMVAFGLQSALVHHMEYGLAYSAASLAAFYLILTQALRRQGSDNLQLLSQAMFALGIIFATLTIPFALDGRWTAASWAIEGAGFVWIALRQQREILKYVGLALQLLGGLLFLIDYPYYGGSWAFINAEFMGIAIISLSALFTAYNLQSENISHYEIDETLTEFKQTILSIKHFIDRFSANALIAWAIIWWYIGALMQVDFHITRDYELVAYVAFLAVSAILWSLASLRFQWTQIKFFPWLLLLPLCLYFWPTIFQGHFLADYGYLSWPLALVTLYGILFKAEQAGYDLFKPTALHSISYLLVISIVSFELAWLVDDFDLASAWSALVVMVVLVIALDLINSQKSWPFVHESLIHHVKAYQQISALVIIGLMVIWSVTFNFMMVLKPYPLTYIPLFNPIDLIQLLALWTVIKWYSLHGHTLMTQAYEKFDPRWALGLCASFIFAWFNVLLLKTIHVVSGVRYDLDAMFDSALVQTTISIAWTLIGLLVMVVASKQAQRQLWLIGAALTAIVVAKLFLLDLSGQGTIERIISFIVVGALLLVVGYLSPVPPAKKVINEVADTV